MFRRVTLARIIKLACSIQRRETSTVIGSFCGTARVAVWILDGGIRWRGNQRSSMTSGIVVRNEYTLIVSVEIISSKIIARNGICHDETPPLRRGLQIVFLIIREVRRSFRVSRAHLRSIESVLLQVRAKLKNKCQDI